ncbi:DUF2179 domain-containing protein [Metallumcola ferriviriculae]|uniref:UPF0316 protein MFMK1_001005 n=1 Tax=Metallumcola ferriviriculae TaxID=3039180 RepID=A0AAU0UM17_9FIRM|nr:DUF2179 domain-containing protein [Desulfitibacteraceae bacterium MK1]
MELIVGYIFIFMARVVDMSLFTVRTLLVVRGQRLFAAFIGFFEVLVYIVALKYVVDQLDNLWSLMFYALGFSTGNIVGSWLEEKLAIGTLTVQVITMTRPLELTCHLRGMGFGVTVWEGQGREGVRNILNIILARKDLSRLMREVNEWDFQAFVTVFDTRSTKGGVLFNRKGK